MDIVERLRDHKSDLTERELHKLRNDAAKTIEAMRNDTKDEKDAESRSEASGEVGNLERYGFLRDKTRKDDGTIKERLYVRCDGRYGGVWALTGKELDEAIDWC
jgi:hypothetical protein